MPGGEGSSSAAPPTIPLIGQPGFGVSTERCTPAFSRQKGDLYSR